MLSHNSVFIILSKKYAEENHLVWWHCRWLVVRRSWPTIVMLETLQVREHDARRKVRGHKEGADNGKETYCSCMEGCGNGEHNFTLNMQL